MFNMQKKESLENVFHNENILKFTDINVYLTSKFMFRYYHGDVHDVFQTFLYLTLMCMNIILDKVVIIICLVWKIIWVNGVFYIEVW